MATRLTKRAVDAPEPREKAYIAFDAEISGFGVRIMPSGVKSFCVEYRPHGGGRGVAKKRLTLGRYGAMTVEQGRQAALTALAERAEKSRQRAALTVADLIDAFLEDHVARLKPKTREGYSAALTKLRKAHGGIKAASLTREHVAALHRGMCDIPYQANWMLAAISKLYAWASEHGRLPEDHPNPARRIPRYKEHARERFLTGGEFAKLGHALRTAPIDPYAGTAIFSLILTGARVNEILHARWSWLDTERGLLNLPDLKTGKKSIFLNAPALVILARLPRLEGTPFIFPGRKKGEPLSRIGRPWATIKQAAGLDGLRLHDLRHSFASIGAGASMGLPVIGKLLGHSQPQTTARYAHLADDPARQAVETIGAEIEAAMSGRKPQPPTPMRRRK